ncbi:hypothetical protein [Acinetobacter modestus]|uniref:hypothetical protein n=1 Tax=Acinetobacter modestus TaxID=1776740 RepID=UPI001F4A46F5|nr:hypothetical protein [Acinetobacter modestus]MCH7330465.1 hypothetical protein [Acinetobacter modestus]
MENTALVIIVEDFLFGRGQNLDNYFIEQTPVSEMLCYRNSEGHEFDLPICDDELAAAVIKRLKEMGVRIIKLS